MSPEQAKGQRVDARSDIFSFGAVLYEMVAGRPAFHGDSSASIIAMILKQEPAPLEDTDERLPRELKRIILRCLRKSVEKRNQSMAEIKLELEELRLEWESGCL